MEDIKKVAIVMSTYNGEKYIEEQLNSILKQSYRNIHIFIRDDGSKDNTVSILEKYKDNNITLIKGENCGFVKSFFSILKQVDDYDYYAFCDQDDVWEENKIERTVNMLSKLDETKPNLYFSNSDYYDIDLKFVAHGEVNKIYNFKNSLVECVSQGMTMCINKTARDMLVENIPQNCISHDCWIYMLCAGLGNMVYDKESLVKYRRHTTSVTAEGKNFIQLQVWRIKKFIFNDSLKLIRKQLIEFGEIYSDKLNEEDKKLIKLFMNEKYSFMNSIKKAFYPKKFRKKTVDEILLRILFLIGLM